MPLPPGPKSRYPGELVLAFNRDPTGFLLNLAREYGDVASFRLGSLRAVLVNDAALIQDVLVTHSSDFIQGPARQQARRLLGNGLITTDGAEHLRKRRVLQPIFHRRQVERFVKEIVDIGVASCDPWRDGASMDVAHEMWRLTLRITARTLFATTVDAEAEEISRAIDNLTDMFNPLFILLADWIVRVPSPFRTRYEQARRALDVPIYSLIREHRESGNRGDLLSMLLSAEEGEANGPRMDDSQVRDEALEIFLAGHGTLALALAWTLYLLAQHPDVERTLALELEEVLCGRSPDVADLQRLIYTRQVLTEAMRLYPPTWVFDRQSVRELELGNYRIPAGSVILLSQWVTHHDPRYYPDPDRFDPSRWAPGYERTRPQFSYFPFGGGPRLCIGEQLAWTEGTLLLAVILQQWHFCLTPETRGELFPRFSLQAKNGIILQAERRRRAGSPAGSGTANPTYDSL